MRRAGRSPCGELPPWPSRCALPRTEVALYRQLATLRLDVPLSETLDDLRWRGPREADLLAFCADWRDDEYRGPRARSGA